MLHMLRVLVSHLIARDIKALPYAISVCFALGLGFYLGARFCAKNVPPASPPQNSNAEPEPESEPEESDDEDEDLADGDLSSVEPRTMEQCKLVGVSQFSVQNFPYGEVQHSGVGCAHRFEDDSRKDCGAVRDCFLCIDVALSRAGVGTSRVSVERLLCWTYDFPVTPPWHVTRHS